MVKIDSIDTAFKDFKNLFKNNGIPVYYVLEKQDDNLEHDHNFMDLETIKKFIVSIKPQYIQIYTDTFQIDEELDSNLLNDLEERERFQKLNLDLRSINNSLIDFTITLPISNTKNPSFGFLCERFDEISEYIYLGNKIIQKNNEAILSSNDMIEVETDENQIEFKTLTKNEIENYVKRLLNEEEFISTSLPTHRKDFIYEFFEKELNRRNIYQILDKAERMLDQYLKMKIKELKKQGKRKFEITSELGISKHRVDKYY
jgi:hypothetical protein